MVRQKPSAAHNGKFDVPPADDRAAHGRHAAAVRIGRDGRERRVGQHPAKQGKAPRPVFAEPTAQKGTVRLPAQTFSRETAKTSAKEVGSIVM